MVTALSDVVRPRRGLEAGADDFLTKPVNDIALFARVRSLVRLKRMMEEWRLREEVCGSLRARARRPSSGRGDLGAGARGGLGAERLRRAAHRGDAGAAGQ